MTSAAAPRRGPSLRRRIGAIALVPIVVGLTIDLVLVASTARQAARERSNAVSATVLDEGATLALALAQDHVDLHTRRAFKVPGPPDDRWRSLAVLSDFTNAAERLPDPEVRDLAVDLGGGIERLHQRTQTGTPTEFLIGTHYNLTRQLVSLLSQLRPSSTSATAARRFEESGFLLDLVVAVLDEDTALEHYLNDPTSATRLNATVEIDRLSAQIDTLQADLQAAAAATLTERSTAYTELIENVNSARPADMTLAQFRQMQDDRLSGLDQLVQDHSSAYRSALDDRWRSLRNELLVLVGILALVALVAAGLARRLYRRLGDQLNRLVQDAEGFRDGRFDLENYDGPDDEIGAVHDAFRRAARTLDAFSEETKRLTASVVAGAPPVRAQAEAFPGQWGALVEGLNAVVDRHAAVGSELRAESRRLELLNELTRLSLVVSTVSDFFDVAGEQILQFASADQVEHWEHVEGHFTCRAVMSSVAESPSVTGNEAEGLIGVERSTPLDGRPGATRLLRSGDQILGALVLVGCREHGALADAAETVAVLVEDRACLEAAARQPSSLTTANPLVSRQAFADAARERLGRWHRDGTSFAVIRIVLAGLDGEDKGTLSQAPSVLRDIQATVEATIAGTGDAVDLGFFEYGLLIEVDDGLDARLAKATEVLRRRNLNIAEHGLGVRVGIAFVDDVDQPSLDALMTGARQAARSANENLPLVRFEAELGYRMTRSARLSLLLRRGLAPGRALAGLGAAYQPVVRLSDRQTVGVEVLARWNPPGMGSVPPDVFVPMAEDLGVVRALDLLTATRAFAELGQAGDLGLHLNASARDFTAGDYGSTLLDLAAQAGVAPQRITVELTETAMIESTGEALRDQFAALRSAGCSIAIDDFGTGYASFSYLVDFPVDSIKIDRSFVTQIESRPDARAVVAGIVRLATDLGLTTVVEGIETEAELAVVRELGCDLGQGYLFSTPVRAADLSLNGGPGPA